MIVGAAAVPTTPLLLPGVSGRLPDGLQPIAETARAALSGLLPSDVTIVVAGAEPTAGETQTATLYATAEGTLSGLGRPDLHVAASVDAPALACLHEVTGCPVLSAGPFPLDLAVLVQLVQQHHGGPVVPLAVPATASTEGLLALGSAIAAAFRAQPRRAGVVAAADLSAGRTERAPLALVPGAVDWDAQVIDIVASGRLGRLTRLGPGEAQRVGARGWAPLVVLHAVCQAAKLAMVVRASAAPRGVGYLVASAA